MLTIENLNSSHLKKYTTNRKISPSKISKTVIEPMFEKFKKNSFKAMKDYTKKYENLVPEKWLLKKEDIEKIYRQYIQYSPKEWDIFRSAYNNINKFHKKQKPKNLRVKSNHNMLGLKYEPIEKVALYVPGGNALYPSTILMGTIPAKIAGVKKITLITPAQQETKNTANIIQATAYYCGVDTIIQAGGAQGIFAAALGVPEIGLEPVDFIYGPGNIYVSCAKNFVAYQNICGVDTFAGPSEVLIIADSNANPDYLAWDMIAQAEHDLDSTCILISNSKNTLNQSLKKINSILKNGLENQNANSFSNAKIAEQSLKNHGRLFYTDSIDNIINFTNAFAPEHLEIQTNNPHAILKKIHSAGSIFLGDYSPVAIGDYYSGTNHILPTSGLSRYSSGINVHSFYKRITYQDCSARGFFKMQKNAENFANMEGLYYHGLSIQSRQKK